MRNAAGNSLAVILWATALGRIVFGQLPQTGNIPGGPTPEYDSIDRVSAPEEGWHGPGEPIQFGEATGQTMLVPPPAYDGARLVAVVEPEVQWPRWFAGASGLLMTRTLPSGHATSVIPGQGAVLATNNAASTWPGGVDLHVGRWLWAEQRHAIEGIYWGVYGIGTTDSITSDSNRLMAIPQAPGVQLGGQSAGHFLAFSRAQEISRSDLVNNVEINWVFAPGGRPEFLESYQRRVTWMWLAGFRFFELQDVLTFTSLSGSVPPGATFGTQGGADQAFLNVATNNNIFGGQVGLKFDWRFLPHVRLAIVPKFMLGGNAVTNTSYLASGTGSTATFPGGSQVNVHSATSTFATVGSVDTGIAWDVTPAWTLSMGYRVVGVGNIIQSDAVWPTSITGAGSLSTLNTSGNSIIHGGFAGFEGRF